MSNAGKIFRALVILLSVYPKKYFVIPIFLNFLFQTEKKFALRAIGVNVAQGAANCL
jgi:hypothetical protein